MGLLCFSFFTFLYLSFPLFIFHLPSYSSYRQPLCQDNERYALLGFKESLLINKFASGDPSGYPKTELWNIPKENGDCCSWDGVKCNEDTGYVIELDLTSSCLYGSINSTSTLFNLVHLQWLSLSDNDFNDSEIPSGIKNLSKLSHLNLSWSVFYGQIPSEIFELSKLESLDLSKNRLPQALQQLPIEKLTNLKVLHLRECDLEGAIPSSLGNLTNLIHLDFYDNKLEGAIPTSLGNLTNLIHLGFSFNNFQGIFLSTSIGNLASLEFLDIGCDIGYCNLSVKDQSSLSNLTKLNHLGLSGINFGEITLWLMNLTRLATLVMNENQLTGTIPLWLMNLKQLSNLYLRSNHLTGPIPYQISNLTQLNRLDLSSNQLQGAIPASLGNLTNLINLDFSYNNLQGAIPASLGNLTNLIHLDFSYNNLQGAILASLGNLTNLIHLDLSGNNLQGALPAQIFQLPNLSFLSVRYNLNFIPEFESSNSLTSLDIRGCNFSGRIPSSIGNLTKLVSLYISYNNFSGELPFWIGNLKSLEELHATNCSLSGPIPSSLGNLKQLTELFMGQNQLVGPIPSSLMNNNQISYLDLSSNRITGQIPQEIMNLTQLANLDLSSNRITGQIPQEIMNPTQLANLDLSSNSLQGAIPSTIFELKNLQNLVLHSNNLSGTIDLDLFFLQLPHLVELELSSNNLSVIISKTSVNTSLQSYSNLLFLGLGSCNLTEFPNFLRNQKLLYKLDLSSNKIFGKIPRWFLDPRIMVVLEALNLSYNLLTGFEQHPIVFSWTKLISLDLRFNRLQGLLPIPHPYTNHYLISNNMLQGEIPLEICNLKLLYALDLSNNNLSGVLPPCMGNFSHDISILQLRNNQFHGSIPQAFLNGSDLRMIDLSNNNFKGRIPGSLLNCTKLEFLHLGKNQISDIFPSWLGTLPELKVLILKSNQLHGVITEPETKFEFSKLRIIDLSHNLFRGELPTNYFQSWNAMKVVDKNQLTYMDNKLLTISSNFSIATNAFRDLHDYAYSITISNKGIELNYEKISNEFTCIILSGNSFEGEIPTSIASLIGLKSLNFSQNKLHGHIPSSLANLTELESLDLSSNRLSGKIPRELAENTFLAVFNVSHNFLTGVIPQGKQFDTFENSSFDGNPGLCGKPLSKTCENSAPSPKEDEDAESPFVFDWKTALIGCASGLIVGVVLGQEFYTRKHEWFVKIFGIQITKRRRVRRN